MITNSLQEIGDLVAVIKDSFRPTGFGLRLTSGELGRFGSTALSLAKALLSQLEMSHWHTSHAAQTT